MNHLITLEGIDGSGKTTLWNRLKDHYAGRDDVIFTREPTDDTWYGEAVQRSLTTDESDPMAELFLYMADHANHLRETVLPALDAGKAVISDRYIDSRIAYQGASLDHRLSDSMPNPNAIAALHEPWSRFPDRTIYLDVDPETGGERSEKANKFEQVDHLQTVRANYLELKKSYRDRYFQIDARTDPDEVFEQALRGIESLQ